MIDLEYQFYKELCMNAGVVHAQGNDRVVLVNFLMLLFGITFSVNIDRSLRASVTPPVTGCRG